MKYNKFCSFLSLSLILALLVLASAIPTHAASGTISLNPLEGKIGDWIEIDGGGFDASSIVSIYFSSDRASEGDNIDSQVTAYEKLTMVYTNASGDFTSSYKLAVPDALTDGRDKEDVHGGDYYFYATYRASKGIIAMASFTVIDGEIELDPEEGTVGSEVEISGEGLRHNQKITVEYEGEEVDIISGDTETDSDGQFTCDIIIPESTMGNHVITVIDESGNRPEAEFSVKPKITLDPAEQVAGGEVIVSGTGFDKLEMITITLDGYKTPTTPLFLYTNYRGSFSGSFLVPSLESYTTIKVEAGKAVLDHLVNPAEAQLTILGGIRLDPVTSPTSPGYVGMELTVYGGGFIANAMVTITYSNNDETIPVATATTNFNGNFSESFTVPPGVAGSHVITATDDISMATATFTMESQTPPMPVPLLPEVAGTVEAGAYFDWGDVVDPSGVSYTLQVASDADFTTIVLEREGLPYSEYTLSEGEKLESTGKEAYYWRVKAVDDACNASEWTSPGVFYVGFSLASVPNWVWYILYGLGALLLGVVAFWVRKMKR
jgi:hypothetical protein